MKKSIAVFSGFLGLAVFGFASAAKNIDQTLKQNTDVMSRRTKPRIDSVIPGYAYTNAIDLVVNGVHFPRKEEGVLRRMIRLVPAAGRGDIFYEGGNRSWTSSKIETFLSADVIPGRKYRAGIVEYSVEAPTSKKLLSNEVEFLLLMKLERVDPSPVPLGVGEIDVDTPNALGPKGSKIVRFAGHQVTVTKWEGSDFRFIIPAGVLRPAVHELFVEEGGQIVSTKLSVKLLGPVIRSK